MPRSRTPQPQLHHLYKPGGRVIFALPDGRTIKLRFCRDPIRGLPRVSIRAPRDVSIRFEDGDERREKQRQEREEAIGKARGLVERLAVERPVIWGPAAAGLGVGPEAKGDDHA